MTRILRPAYGRALETVYGRRGLPWSINGETFRIIPGLRHLLPPVNEAPLFQFLSERIEQGDVVFDIEVIEELLERGPDCLAVRSVGGIGLEEVKVTADNEDRVLAIGKHVPVRSAMGESVGIELFSAASSRRLFDALHDRVSVQGLVNEYYEASFQQVIDEGGVTLYGVDIGSMYATEIDTIDDLLAANARVATRPAFDISVDALRLAV